MISRIMRRVLLVWFVIALLAVQLSVVALSVALALNVPGVANAMVGVATLILATLTGLVLVYNASVLNATRESAEATRQEAEATRDEAHATREQAEATKRQADIALETLEELRRSRELDAQPLIVRQEAGVRTIGGRAARDLVVTNIGRGPALNCIYLHESAGVPPQVVRTGGFNLAANHSAQITAEEIDEDPGRLGNPFASIELPREALFCQDQFGNVFRFTPGIPIADVVARHAFDQANHSEVSSWLEAYSSLIARREPEPQPNPSAAFMQAIHVGNFSQCQTTVAWESVPPTDLALSDIELDTIGESIRSLEPRSKRESAEVARWAFPPGGSLDEVWRAAAYAGPCVSMTTILALKAKPSPNGQGVVAGLPLTDLATWWQVATMASRRLAVALHVQRMRLGLTLTTYGNPDKPRLQDVDFDGLPRPDQTAPAGYYVQHFSGSSEPFDVSDWPQGFLESSVREILRRFGFRDLDGIIAGLPFSRPLSDPRARASTGAAQSV